MDIAAEATAEVIAYSRAWDIDDVEVFADCRWFCGDCWRASPINLPQDCETVRR
jgi:hypothetical protein